MEKNNNHTTTEVADDKDASAFLRSSRLTRSPVETFSIAATDNSSTPRGGQHGLFGAKGVTSQMSTPSGSTKGGPPVSTPSSSTTQEGLQLARPKVSMVELNRKVIELHEYVKGRNNVHTEIKQRVSSLRYAVLEADREHTALRKRAETAEKALKLALEQIAAVEASTELQETPKGRRNKNSNKRDRETPGEEERPKKTKNVQGSEELSDERANSDWNVVKNRKEKKKNQPKKEETKGNNRIEKGRKPARDERRSKENRQERRLPHRERHMGDALLVKANDQQSYAAILKKVREDPELKELGENVVRTRRTQQGDMLFELKKDPAIKSSAYREQFAKSLGDLVGDGGNVKALCQEATIECRYLDEITTVEELGRELKTQCELGEEVLTIRLTKGYQGTQTAMIRLSVPAASKLLKVGKVRVGCSVCPLRVAARIAKSDRKRVLRCFKCMGFGHMSANCKGPDRSEQCRKCGEKGHFAKDCSQAPKCMLCTAEEGNVHSTGGYKCPAYKKAIAGQQ